MIAIVVSADPHVVPKTHAPLAAPRALRDYEMLSALFFALLECVAEADAVPVPGHGAAEHLKRRCREVYLIMQRRVHPRSCYAGPADNQGNARGDLVRCLVV